MRFGSRDLTGLRAQSANYRLHPPSFWLPTALSDSVTASSTRPQATCTASGTAHTKGSWSEVIASTVADATMLEVIVLGTFTNGTNTTTLLDIGVGAASSESVVIADIPVGYLAGATLMGRFPLFLPAGSRISIRCQSAVTSKQVTAILIPYRMESNLRAAPTATTYGTTSASSKGTTLTSPGSLNTKSAWTEITSATTERLGAISVFVGEDGSATVGTTGGTAGFLVDVGMGGAGNEVVIVQDVYGFCFSQENMTLTNLGPFPVDIPAGTRLAVRYARASTGNTLDATLVGFPVRGG